jgi:hypothetical protein
MPYQETVRRLAGDAEQLELTYQQAVTSGQADAFDDAIHASYAEAPDNLLYAAWHYRLAHAAARVRGHVVAWAWAIPLAVLNGLLLWWLSDDQRYSIQLLNPAIGQAYNYLPTVVMLAAPISAALILVYLTFVGRKRWPLTAAVILGLGAFSAYVLLFYGQTGLLVFQEQYLTLMVLHLLLLSWAAVGAVLLARCRDSENRFAFLIKSLEVFIMGGLFAIAGGLLTLITFGLFQALGIEPPDEVVRLFVAGGAGLIAVLAVAVIYDPTVDPAHQPFHEGLSKLVALLMRLLLPLALLVLVVYLAFIPFNFGEPFENRDVLIIFNAMLFAVIALLVGATPVSGQEPDQRLQTWLRRGIIALAALALIVSLYAFAAILYRTAIDRLTPNRLTFIGWNVINIGILIWLLVQQWRAGRARWLPALHSTFAAGMIPYVLWTVIVILALPWLFTIHQGNVEGLPRRVQVLVYEQPYPILLKCPGSPHVYLLEEGEKRWVKDIPTFEARGFEWREVSTISCADLRSVPDGPPIPPDAGPPPVP